MLAPADQISLWLHGVVHEFPRRGRAATSPCRTKRQPALPQRGHGSAKAAMTGVPGRATPADGAPRHVPVLLREVIANVMPHDGGVYVDGTFGAGGYTAA